MTGSTQNNDGHPLPPKKEMKELIMYDVVASDIGSVIDIR